MTVQAAGSGATIAGTLFGAGAAAGSDGNIVSDLARTGASEASVLITVAMVLVLMGVLVLGLARRHDKAPSWLQPEVEVVEE